MRFVLLAMTLLLCTQCSYRWSDTSATTGEPLPSALSACRAQAAESARKQAPLGFGFGIYSGGGVSMGASTDSAADIEKRETALCLKKKGFKMIRND